MGDSDEEYHRRSGREKFMRERNDYCERPRPREHDFDSRRNFQRGDYSNGSSIKRSSSARREDHNVGMKRNRIDSTSDSYDPILKTTSEDEQVPVMKTFKKFLAAQDDSITDEEAISKYSEYKMEFKRLQLSKFFKAHKDEEWFRVKYHPEECAKRKAEQKENVERRLQVFKELNESGALDNVSIEYESAADIIRIMDTLVVKLEGGNDEDIAALLEEDIEDESVAELKKLKGDIKNDVLPAEKSRISNLESEESSYKAVETGTQDLNDVESSVCSKPLLNIGRGPESKCEELISEFDEDSRKRDDEKDNEIRTKKRMMLHKTSSIFLRNVSPNISSQEIEEVCKRFPGFLRLGLAEPLPERKFSRRGWVTFRRDVNIKGICWSLNNIRIHDTDLGAIVNRDLARRVRSVNGITNHKQVAQNDLQQAARLTALYDARASLYQAQVETNSGASFDMDILSKSSNPLLQNITEFLIEEANAEEEELLGIVNGGNNDEQKMSFHKDLQLLKKLDRIILYLRIVHSIDFYNHGEYPNEDFMPNRCGMMHVRGMPPSGSQYAFDEQGSALLTQKFISDFIAGFNGRLETNLITEIVLSDSDLENLGKKDPEKDVEEFISANCIELAKDKWLCPLSGKKFKGPEFIRKHLATKHQEKLDEVRLEAEYFNNYIMDGKRLHFPEAKPTATSSVSASRDDRRERDPFDTDRLSGRIYGGASMERNRGYGARYENRRYDRIGSARYPDLASIGRRDPREPISYKDLDAPDDMF